MSIWHSIRKLLPHLYVAVGGVLLLASWLVRVAILPMVLLVLGAVSLGAGIALWLHRKEDRAYRAEYTGRSLDD
jgi:hypothetical protein